MRKVQNKAMDSSHNYPKILHADQEHAGLRTAVFILLFVSLFVAFFGLRALFNAIGPDWVREYAVALACGSSFPMSVGIIWVAEKYMKQYWPSGRLVTLTHEGISVETEMGEKVTLTQAQGVLPLAWHFELRGWQRGGRERRVPQSWLCLSIELKAGKEHIIVYTYMPPNQADRWLESDSQVQFYKIFPQNVYDNSLRNRVAGPSRPEIPPEVITSKDGPYWLAERRRWIEGFDLPPEEFNQFMTHIQTNLLN
jgi:hypothetical protein